MSDLPVHLCSYRLIEKCQLACVYGQLHAHREMSVLPVYIDNYMLIEKCQTCLCMWAVTGSLRNVRPACVCGQLQAHREM